MFFIIPSSFALDNQTNFDVENSDLVLESTSSDVLSGNNDYYFNASADEDGDGSESNPYKFLTKDKLKENSFIHLSEGEYELDDGKTIYNITLIGHSSEDTVLKFKNNNSILSAMTSLTLKNLTLVDVTLLNYGTLTATNVIFKDSVGYLKNTEGTNLVNSASNSFGGAIYCPNYVYSVANVNIDNCTFINNTAEYGGAIYMHGGILDIKNSLFYDNYAYNYGGAIAGEYSSKITVENTRFINSSSINDAGGAIYLKESKLTADNISIINSTGTFGSAITSLSTTLSVNKLKAYNNYAKYEGGAIYQFYGSLTLRNSNFTNNSANNGGALFIDNTTSTILYQNTFTDNSALGYGGAVYSLLNTKTRINYNEYFNNKAKIENDFYETSAVSIVIGSGNYTMYKYNSNFTGVLPSNYSSLVNGYVTSVKDQQSGGNCWAFAGIAVLESCILKASGDNLDLSEENMKNLMELYSDYGWNMDTNGGGYPSMIMGYLTSWMGPVLEIEDLNDDYSTLSPILNSYMHVQNIKYIKRTSFTDNDAIKEAVIKYGAVGTGIYYDSTYFNEKTNSYYGSIGTYSNHAVTIVGWDDNYSRKNFINRPSGDGAFLVKNSWNTDWGNEGYFYVSYYDTSFAAIGDDEASYTFILNDTIKYDKNYQHDIIGKTDYFVTGNKNIWYQNVFTSTSDEFLAAVSTYFEKQCSWDLSIYVNDALKLVKSGTGECGYCTIDLGNYIPLKTGDIFKVMFKITGNSVSFPVSEKTVSNKVIYEPGTSFFSNDGKKWIDLYDYVYSYSSHSYTSQVACIKAFTFIDEIQSNIKLDISNKGFNPVSIVAIVENQFGNLVSGGNVTFTINGKNYVVGVVNGIANLTLDLEEMATSYIEANFNSSGYLSSQANATVTINKKTADLDLDIIQHSTTTTIKVNISKMINETVLISLNGNNYTIDAINGFATLILENIPSGNYTINARILDDIYVNTDVSKDFNLDVKDSQILADDFVAYYNGGNIYTVTLMDENGELLSNCELIFRLNGRSFKKLTDDNGTASLSVTLTDGIYDLDIQFDGNEKYINSSNSVKLTVKSSIISSEYTNYTFNSVYPLKILDKNGNGLNNTNVSVNIGDNVYNLTTDENGTAFVNIAPLQPGKYSLYYINPGTGEKFEQIINVIPRITENKGFTMYFGSGASYKLRILNDYGEFVGSGEEVTIKISGKTYTVKTLSNGYATFKINLKANKYTITAEYKGYKVSNKIIVKPVLTAKNISKKKAKKIKFQAKLVNTKGKALKNKKISFKFKGKAYKVKTNSKGIATLSLKNLKVGKHVIYSIYGKSKIKNTIKIKK